MQAELRYISRAFFHSSFYLAVGTALAGYSTFVLLGAPVSYTSILLLFFVTFSVYNFNRITDREEDNINHPNRTKFTKERHSLLMFSSISAYVIALLLGFLVDIAVFGFVLFPAVTILFYSVDLDMVSIRRFKDIFIIKNLFAGTAWGISIFGFIYLVSDITLGIKAFLTIFTISYFTTLNTILFDIRDVEGDQKNGISTLPVVFDTTTTERTLKLALFVFMILVTVFLMIDFIPERFVILLTTAIYLFLVVSLVQRRDMGVVTDILGDGWLVVFGVQGVLLNMFI